MGPRVPFAPALLTLSLYITLHIYFISSRLFILLYVTCVMVNKAAEKKKNHSHIVTVGLVAMGNTQSLVRERRLYLLFLKTLKKKNRTNTEYSMTGNNKSAAP